MGIKNALENRVRCWLPEELRILSHRQTRSHKTPIAGIRFGILLLVSSFAGSFLVVLDSFLGLFSGVGLYVFVAMFVVWIAVAIIIVMLRYSKKRSIKT